jgi:Ctr copper transporter family
MRTFADMRKAMSGSEMKDRTFLYMGDDERDDISIGCGVSRSASSFWTTQGGATRINRRRLQMVDDASACNNATNFFCWMSCLEIPDVDMAAEKINDGYSLYCLDPAKLFDSGNNVSVAHAACIGSHNDGCMGSWQQTVPGVPSQDLHVDEESINAAAAQFCYGGTSMYMDGFHWTDPTCIIYLFPNWVLSSSGRLVGASIGTLFFGVALEAVIWKRRSFVQSVPLGWKRLTASTLFYGLQLTMGYMIMLVVMTYSGPLFMCVIFGLMSGHAIFNAGSVLSSKSNTESRSLEQDPGTEEGPKGSGSFGSQTTIPEGITPCCQNTL